LFFAHLNLLDDTRAHFDRDFLRFHQYFMFGVRALE
jgi:hypothetical protein